MSESINILPPNTFGPGRRGMRAQPELSEPESIAEDSELTENTSESFSHHIKALLNENPEADLAGAKEKIFELVTPYLDYLEKCARLQEDRKLMDWLVLKQKKLALSKSSDEIKSTKEEIEFLYFKYSSKEEVLTLKPDSLKRLYEKRWQEIELDKNRERAVILRHYKNMFVLVSTLNSSN